MTELNAKSPSQEVVLRISGQDGYNQLVATMISDLFEGFSEHGASCVEAILSAKTFQNDQAKLD